MSLKDEKEKGWGVCGGFLGAILGIFLGAHDAALFVRSIWIIDIACIPEVVITLLSDAFFTARAGILLGNFLPGGPPRKFTHHPLVLAILALIPVSLSFYLFRRITQPMSDQELLSLYASEKPALTALAPIVKQNPSIGYGEAGPLGGKPASKDLLRAFGRAFDMASPRFLSTRVFIEEGSFGCVLWDYDGYQRGFAYLPKPPKPSEIYKDLSFNDFSYQCETVYKPVEGHWYLFYYCDPS